MINVFLRALNQIPLATVVSGGIFQVFTGKIMTPILLSPC